MDTLSLTLDLIERMGWEVVLLATRSKMPAGSVWSVTSDTTVIRHHVLSGGNVGLVCGPKSGVAVLDFDADNALVEMSKELGVLQPWVLTGSGKQHCYVSWEEGLPARLSWRGVRVGDVQRGPTSKLLHSLQHVVMPPSVHPKTGKSYTWLIDAVQPLPSLPKTWRDWLGETAPGHLTEGDRRGQPEEETWTGASSEEILALALRQPGAKKRVYGIKFQCPGCRKQGRDRSRDNGIAYNDGHWGCAVDPDHKKDLAELFSVSATVAQEAAKVQNKVVTGTKPRDKDDLEFIKAIKELQALEPDLSDLD